MSTQENDLLYMRFLQEKGLMRYEREVTSETAPSKTGDWAKKTSFESVDIAKDMDSRYLDFIRSKGIHVPGDPEADQRGVYESLGNREPEFQAWYKGWATKAGLSQDPNPDLHKYDYRKAFLAGLEPKVDPTDSLYHWDSKFKYRQEVEGEDHPNRWVDGVDTTGALPSQQEQAAFIQKEFAPTAPRMKLEKTGEVVDSQGRVTPTFKFTRPPKVSPGTWKQALDILGVLAAEQRGLLPPDVTGKVVQTMVKSATLNILDVWKVAEQASGQPGLAKELEDRYVTATQVVGYDPNLGRIRFEEVAKSMAMLVPYAKVAQAASLYGKSFIKAAPIAQRFIAAMFAGAVTGAAQIAGEKLAGEPFDLVKDLPKIPTHILYWTALEALGMTWEQVSKVVNWNMKYGGKPFGTGKRGGYEAAQGIEFETQYAPGRGPTTRANFTAEEIRDIYRRADPNYTGAGKVSADPGDWERQVYEGITGTNGWREAVRRGWIPPRPVNIPGETPIVTGRTVKPTGTVPPEFGGQPVPLKPEFADVFRTTPRQYPAPGIVGTPPGAPAMAPGAMPPPGTAGGPLPGGGGTTEAPPRPSQAPPPGTAPPAVTGVPRAGAPPPVEQPPIITPPPVAEAPKAKPKIKVTPQEDGSFTVETVTEPPPITEKPIITPPPAEPTVAPVELRTDQPLRDAVVRMTKGEGTPEDARVISSAANRNDRLKKVVEDYKARTRVDVLTGVGSDIALRKVPNWESAPQVRFDLAGVREANNDPARGHEWTDDNIFKPAGKVFRDLGDDAVYRKGGTADEFVILGKEGQSVEGLTAKAQLMKNELEKQGVGSYFGVGRNGSDAERFMAENKATAKAARFRSPAKFSIPEHVFGAKPIPGRQGEPTFEEAMAAGKDRAAEAAHVGIPVPKKPGRPLTKAEELEAKTEYYRTENERMKQSKVKARAGDPDALNEVADDLLRGTGLDAASIDEFKKNAFMDGEEAKKVAQKYVKGETTHEDATTLLKGMVQDTVAKPSEVAEKPAGYKKPEPEVASHAGQAGWSTEALSRGKTLRFSIYDTKTGKETPLIGVDAVDIQPKQGQVKYQVNKITGKKEVVDVGPNTIVPKADIAGEVYRLTSGKFFPREWQGNTDIEVQDNRQNLARFVLENYTPDKGPLENYINANKGFFIRGEAGRKGMAKLKREQQFPKTVTGGEKDFGEDKSVFGPESQPKGKKPPEPEIPGDPMKPDVFGAEEIRVMNALRSTAQTYTKSLGEAPGFEDNAVDILKSRLLSLTPESFRSIGERLGYSKSYVKKQYDAMLEILKDSPAIKEIMARRMMQLNIGPVPSEQDLKHLAKMLRKYFSSYRGADKIIDQQNDARIGGRMAEIFDQTIDASKINKWLKDQPEGTNEYLAQLMRGTMSGDGMEDIQNSVLPADIKEAMLHTRQRVDRLSDLVITHGGLVEETRATFENNIGKYLTKAYRLYEQIPHGVWPFRTGYWSPTDAQKDGFKRWLMNEYTMTPEQADEFIEAELAYGRNDEGIRPQRSRRTRRVPTEHFIRRKVLSPAWREFAGEIDRLPWLVMHTITKQATMAYNAKFLDWISEYLPDHWTADYQEAAQRGWQNSQFAEHNYAYGKLAGKWVDPELYQYIKSEFDTARSDMEEAIQKFIMNPFKWTKTIGSLPSHPRNFLSNFGFSMLLRNSILNPLNAKWYTKSLNIHLNNRGSSRDAWSELIKEGVTETQFYGREIPRLHKDVMRFDPATWPEKIWDKFLSWPIDKLGELYNFGDSLYRVSAYLKNTAPRSEGGFGMAPTKAVEELNAGLQNYRKLAVAVDFLRRWPVFGPFISFKANTVKIIGNQARMATEEIKNTATRSRGIGRYLRLALFLSIPAILSEISKKVFDVDEKQIKELERWYPEYRRNGTFLYFRGEDDKLKVFDFSFLWPTGDIERFGKSILKGDVAGAKDSLDFFSHPLFDIWSILIKGQDPQWGTKYRTIIDRAKAAAAYLYLPASMPIPNLEGLLQGEKYGPATIEVTDPNTGEKKRVPNPEGGNIRPGKLTGPQIKAVIDAYNGQPDPYGRVKQLPEEIKNFFSGIRTWDVDPEKLLAQAAIQRDAQIRLLRGEYAKWLRKNTLAPQWEKDAKNKDFVEGVEKISAELRDIGAIGRELRAGGFKAKTK